MLIQCPECSFSRTLDESKIPPTAQVATCPRCKARFRFRNLEDNADSAGSGRPDYYELEQNGQEAAGQNDSSRTMPGGETDHPVTGPAQASKHRNGERDLWDNIASLGEKWKQDDAPHAAGQGRSQTDSESAENFAHTGRSGMVPWEHPEHFGLFGGYFKTIVSVLMRGKLFFSAMPQDAPVGRALAFYFLTALLHFLISFMWLRMFTMSPEVAANLEQLNTGLNQISLAQLVGFFLLNAALTLAMLGMLFSIMFRICGVKYATLRRTVRVLCYASSGLLLVVIPIIGPVMSMLFVVFSSLKGFICFYGLPPVRAALLVVPVYFLLFMIMFSTSMSAM
ncbi:MAG: zinc-ribbon domain-containing protein [Desulfovibrionaceae bacterium]|nr:zinc-ribbon domain-containing protein [Desulfovibrionaceae bacterium]